MTEPLLDQHSADPLHHQLQRIFIRKIESGEWPHGYQLEGEMTSSSKYGVSRATVRQAILALVNQGYLTRKQGKGTFVSRQKHDMNVLDLKFTALAHSGHRLLSVETDLFLPEEAEQLGLAESERITVLKRLRLEKDEPVALERAYLPSSIVEGIHKADLTLPLLDILRANHGVSIKRYSATIEPVLLDPQEQAHLEYDADPALGLLITRIGFSTDEKPTVLTNSTFRGDLCRMIFNH